MTRIVRYLRLALFPQSPPLTFLPIIVLVFSITTISPAHAGLVPGLAHCISAQEDGTESGNGEGSEDDADSGEEEPATDMPTDQQLEDDC